MRVRKPGIGTTLRMLRSTEHIAGGLAAGVLCVVSDALDRGSSTHGAKVRYAPCRPGRYPLAGAARNLL